jgi:hypothetical protein
VPPSIKKGRNRYGEEMDVPDGIIAYLTMECCGNVHDCHIVDITSGSFEKETRGANPHSGAHADKSRCAAKKVADLETVSRFYSAFRWMKENIPHTRNKWICYDFKERRIVPTYYTIRTRGYYGPGGPHLKSWLVETSTDRKRWRKVAHKEDNKQLNGNRFTATFPVAGGGECRFIRLVNIGRNHRRNNCLRISVWETFGNLVE